MAQVASRWSPCTGRQALRSTVHLVSKHLTRPAIATKIRAVAPAGAAPILFKEAQLAPLQTVLGGALDYDVARPLWKSLQVCTSSVQWGMEDSGKGS